MRILRYIGRRFLFIGPQLFGIILVSFLLVKLIPGDPAVMMLGPFATEQQIAMLNAEMGLEGTIIDQFWIYLQNLVQGDLGTSWQTTKPVLRRPRHPLPGDAGARSRSRSCSRC